MFRIVMQLARLTALLCGIQLITGCPSAAVDYDYASLPDPTASPYKVRPGDVVHVRVLRNENTTGTYTVRPDGFISMPLGGEIRISGLSTEEARQQVVKRLSKFIEDAQEMISVSIDQVRGIRYSVIGEVNRAGMFESQSYVTLLEALANAGGLTVYAQPEGVYVLRRAEKKQLRIPVSYTQTVKDPSGNRNFYLLSGDVVVVP
jgi:polysaccharide export outer membrane protein